MKSCLRRIAVIVMEK